MKCLSCDTPNDDDARFCKQCGAALSVQPPAAQPATPQAAPPPALADATQPLAPAVAPTTVPAQPAPVPAPPMPASPMPAPPVVPPAAQPYFQAPQPASVAPLSSVSGWLIGCLAVAVLLLLAAVGVAGYLWLKQSAKPTPDSLKPLTKAGPPAPAPEPPKPPVAAEQPADKATPPVPDAVKKLGGDVAAVGNALADARKVMERFMELDMKHDGYGMQKLMGGEALKSFRPDLMSEYDPATPSETITKEELVSAHKVRFQVRLKYRDMDEGAENNIYDWYELTKGDDGWKITKVQYGE